MFHDGPSTAMYMLDAERSRSRIAVAHTALYMTYGVARWLSGRASDLQSRSRGFEVRPRRCCATTLGKLFTPYCLSPNSIIWYQRKLGSKQAYRVVHQPVSRGLAVFTDAWLSGWLAEISADLRENGSALEVVLRRCAIQIHDFTLLFTLLEAFSQRCAIQMAAFNLLNFYF